MDPQTQQIIQQMQQQLQQQAQQLAHQQQQLLHAQHTAAASSSSSSSQHTSAVASKPLVKPKPPSTFNATDKAGELDQWEREMRYQFAAYGPALASGPARIAHAVSYLGAIPLQWWDANPEHHDVDTWEAFVRLLRERFRPVNAAKLARIELFKIRQGATQTAGAHAARFQELLVSLPQMHEDDRIHLFVYSLTPALKRRVGDKDFTTLSAAINAAVQSEGLYGAQLSSDAPPSSSSSSTAMDLNYLEDDEYEEEQPAPRRQTALGGPLSRRPPEDQLAMMRERLFALERNPPGRRRAQPRDSVEDIDENTAKERLRMNACLRCGSADHWKSDCPQAPPRRTAGRR